MLEVCPYLKHESHAWIIIFNGRPNLPHCIPRPLLKVEVGSWIGHASHGHAQING